MLVEDLFHTLFVVQVVHNRVSVNVAVEEYLNRIYPVYAGNGHNAFGDAARNPPVNISDKEMQKT